MAPASVPKPIRPTSCRDHQEKESPEQEPAFEGRRIITRCDLDECVQVKGPGSSHDSALFSQNQRCEV